MLRGSTTENGMRVKLLATMAMGVAMSACAGKPLAPFASVPFSIAHKGNAISIPFDVGPFEERRYRYMLALKYTRLAQQDPIAPIQGASPRFPFRLRVKLVRIERGQEYVVAINDHVETTYNAETGMHCHGEGMAARGTDIARVMMHGHSATEELMEVVNFTLPDKGSHRFDVETLDDVTMFETIATRLTVEREYRHGK